MGQQVFIRGLRGLASLPKGFVAKGCVATIGSFDGVHLGHQAIIKRLNEEASARGIPSLVMIFEPQPHEYFSREKAPARLMRLRDKVYALFAEGVDYVLCLRFDQKLRSLSAKDFIEQILHQGLKVQHLEIGDDFRFGCDRAGNFKMLQETGKNLGFSVCDTQTHECDDERISSTRIRKLLEQDRLAKAAELLGKPFEIAGRVIYGRQLGRTIGVATANIALGRYRTPVSGVYAVKATLPCGQKKNGVANIGVKPTVDEGLKPLLEVHLFDFEQTIYGERLSVELCHKLREEMKFDSVDKLIEQIEKDLEDAKNYFG